MYEYNLDSVSKRSVSKWLFYFSDSFPDFFHNLTRVEGKFEHSSPRNAKIIIVA